MQNTFITPDFKGIIANTNVSLGEGNNKNDTSLGAEFYSLLSNQLEETAGSNQGAENYGTPINLNRWDFSSSALFNRIDTGIQTTKLERPQKVNVEQNKTKTNEAISNKLPEKEKPCRNEATQKTSNDSEGNKTQDSLEGTEMCTEVNPESMAVLELKSDDEISATLAKLESQLSEEELAFLLEDPNLIEEKLQVIVAELEDPELKEQLVQIMDNEESKEHCLNFIMDISALSKPENSTQKVELNLEQEDMNLEFSKKPETHIKPATEVKTEAKVDKAIDEEKLAETVSSEGVDVKQASSKNEKTDYKDKPEHTSKKLEFSESIREEFARLHEVKDEPTLGLNLGEAETQASENLLSDDLLKHFEPTVVRSSELSSMVDKLVEKVFEQLESKQNATNNGSEKGKHSLGSTTDLGSLSKVSSSMSGNNSGFSFQSGLGRGLNYEAAKSGQASNVSHSNFTEMLEKAELVKTKDGAKVLNIEIDQAEMGKLEMELKSKDGVVTARLSAENESVKTELEKLTPQIREQLINQGINLELINVEVSSGNSNKHKNENADSVSNTRGRFSIGNKISFEELLSETSRLDVLTDLRRAALNIQYIDEIV